MYFTIHLQRLRPPIDNHSLTSKFAEILYKENAYWEEYKLEDKWPKWIFIQFKSFTNSSRQILGLNFTNNKITFTLTDTIDNHALTKQSNRSEISLFDVWLDHSKLFQKFLAIAIDSIIKSNPTQQPPRNLGQNASNGGIFGGMPKNRI